MFPLKMYMKHKCKYKSVSVNNKIHSNKSQKATHADILQNNVAALKTAYALSQNANNKHTKHWSPGDLFPKCDTIFHMVFVLVCVVRLGTPHFRTTRLPLSVRTA